MSSNNSGPLQKLPAELLHHIFDYLDVQTIVLSFSQVCRLFRSATKTYNRYALNCQSISQLDLYRLCRMIQPQNVISLTLSEDENTPDLINLFLSYVRIKQFAKLRSLTLIEINECHIKTILKYVDMNNLTSISINIGKYDERRKDTTINILSSLIAGPNLRKIHLSIKNFRMSHVSWTMNCGIRHLKISESININYLSTIFRCCPFLHTLELNNCLPTIPISFLDQPFSQLTSLIIKEDQTKMDTLESFLLLTPSLTYLNIISKIDIIDGKRWEQFIQSKLPKLNKFEFFFNECGIFNNIELDMKLIFEPFRSVFWTMDKKWFITCLHSVERSDEIQFFTIPYSKSTYIYIPQSQLLSLTTHIMTIDNDPSIMHNIEKVILYLTKKTADGIIQKEMSGMCPLFRKATKLRLNLVNESALPLLQWMSIFVDLSKIVEIEFNNRYFDAPNDSTWIDIINFVSCIPNLSSIIINERLFEDEGFLSIENICLMISNNVKHLQIAVRNLNEVKFIFENCEYLSSIKLEISSLNLFKDIKQWISENSIHSRYQRHHDNFNIWIGKKSIQSTEENNINCKRIKLSRDN